MMPYLYPSYGYSAQIGTVAGRHTVAETRQLMAVVDYRFRETEKAIEAMKARGLPANIDERTALLTDWTRALAAWRNARPRLVLSLKVKNAATVLPSSFVPSEDEWLETLAFVEGQELRRGSLQDVVRRVERATGQRILFAEQPSQNASDPDLAVYRELDREIRAGEGGAKSAGDAIGEFVAKHPFLVIGGAVAISLLVLAPYVTPLLYSRRNR